MRKKIKKWGDSLVIRLSPDDKDMYDIKEGDIVDVMIRKVPEEEIEVDREVDNAEKESGI